MDLLEEPELGDRLKHVTMMRCEDITGAHNLSGLQMVIKSISKNFDVTFQTLNEYIIINYLYKGF